MMEYKENVKKFVHSPARSIDGLWQECTAAAQPTFESTRMMEITR